MDVNITSRIKIPDVPETLTLLPSGVSVPLSTFQDKELQKIGRAYTDELVKAAEAQRKQYEPMLIVTPKEQCDPNPVCEMSQLEDDGNIEP